MARVGSMVVARFRPRIVARVGGRAVARFKALDCG